MLVRFCAALAAVVALLAGAARAGSGSTLKLPPPTGASPVGLMEARLADSSRIDELAPTPGPRELMVHVWYPASSGRGQHAAYLPRTVAALYSRELGLPPSLLGGLRSAAWADVPAARGRHPVVLFSPGYGVSVIFNSLQAEELASQGYVVVAIDHTYEAPVEFPGERLVEPTLANTQADAERAAAVRLADVRFVLRRLATLGRPVAGHLDLGRVGMVGHSLGGATAASLMLEDRRIAVGVDIDGSVRGAVVDAGLDRPFMLMLSPGHFGHDPSLLRFSRRQRGPLVRATFAGVGHLGFTDLMALVPQLARRVPELPREVPVGTADPVRAVTAQRVYLRAFLDTYLRARPSPLLRRGAARLPGVDVVDRGSSQRMTRGSASRRRRIGTAADAPRPAPS